MQSDWRLQKRSASAEGGAVPPRIRQPPSAGAAGAQDEPSAVSEGVGGQTPGGGAPTQKLRL